jgi:hypothetical protein
MTSRILHHLKNHELKVLEDELALAEKQWAFHYLKMTPQSAPLRHGSSIYIQSLHVVDHSVLLDNRNIFPNTIKSVAALTGNKAERLGRSYWHRLKPGDRIDVHRDRDSQDGAYFSKVKRYQVYMSLPSTFVVVMDGTLWNFDEDRMLSERLIEFNHSDWHYYANHSEKDIHFLVMDFFRE